MLSAPQLGNPHADDATALASASRPVEMPLAWRAFFGVPDSMPASLRIIQRANRTLGRVAPRTVARLNQRLFASPRRFAPREWELAFESIGTRSRLPNGASVLTVGAGARTVALIHGWEGRATQFAAFVPPLLAHGFRVIGIDGPAHGHSRGAQADPYRFAETLHEASARFGPLHGVIGHSMGGGSAVIALAAGLDAARAVIIASPASLHEVLHRFATAMHLPPGATTHFVERMRAQVLARGHRDVDVLALLRELRTSALVVHARDDRDVPFGDGQRIAETWTGARLLPVDGVGHRRILRDPSVIEQVVAFLA
jgi:pimeloyl-ACP methyl ester carboxylesterase